MNRVAVLRLLLSVVGMLVAASACATGPAAVQLVIILRKPPALPGWP
jgi:hypothetical protein